MMVLVPIYCAECPSWHPLPAQGIPLWFWLWGPNEPPADLSSPGQLPMDVGHDIRLEADRFRYQYSGGKECWIVLQYGTPGEMPCPHCTETIPDNSKFCPQCGQPTRPI